MEGPLNCGFNVTKVERLSDVIECPNAHCFNCAFNILVSTDHHYDRVRVERVQTRDKLKTAHSTHIDITHDELKLFSGESLESLFS